jgi:thiamine-phosphate pyrophosphorylase
MFLDPDVLGVQRIPTFMNPTAIAGLYAIADTRVLDDARLVLSVSEAIAGGARVVQYRDKSADEESRRRQAQALSDLCRAHGTMFVVNDDVELAAEVTADGVHLGRDDVSIVQARAQLGRTAVIGISCYNDLPRALDAQAQGADYVAFGSFFASRTKPQAVRAPVELLRQARTALALPIVAIGGITPENGAHLLAAGADALAVIDGVFGQANARAAANRYAMLFGARATATVRPSPAPSA